MAEEQDEVVRTWLDKALALKSAGYVQPDQQPTDLQTAFELTLTTADGPTTLVVSSGTNTDGENTWYASSEHTRDNLVELHSAQASEASIDLDAVFDAEEEPPEDEALPQDDE